MHTLQFAAGPQSVERDFLALGDGGDGPAGRLAVNNRCLERDGRPWLPVMGEFHYSRCPADEWADELRRMRAGGIDIVASYVFWSHHEAEPGRFDWSGRLDLRRFAQEAHRAGLMFHLRPGPWVHAEARLGGLPGWLVDEIGPPALRSNDPPPLRSNDPPPLRSNDPRYLAHVRRFLAEVGQQLQGLMWRDGGPLVGVQIENEYDGRGAGRGAEHIAELKRIAQASGLRVPLWTVTGWPTLDIPEREVLPVSGAYPDGFWGGATGPLPPSGVFAFNTGRSIGEMGHVGGTPPEGRIDPAHYPFFLAEAGGGMQVSYHRRPVVGRDDVAACALVQIGSGANLYGYYMYHGGTNPGPGLQETQASGYPNDVAELGYDFRAPLGQYGQLRASYGRLRTLHSFLAAFGAELALMASSTSGSNDPADLSTLRVAARGAGNSGFVFVNNHCRHHPLPAFTGVQLNLRLGDGSAQAVPGTPVDVPSGAYFIWPVGQRLGAALLRHATVQPLTRWSEGDGVTWVGFVLPGVRAELCFELASLGAVPGPIGWQADVEDGTLTLQLDPATPLPQILSLTDAQGTEHRLLLLSQAQADACQRQRVAGRERLIQCEHALHFEGDTAVVLVNGEAELQAWPADDLGGGHGFAQWRQACPRPDDPALRWQLRQDAQEPPAPRDGPWVAWRGRAVPLAPPDVAYEQGLRLSLRLEPQATHRPGTRTMLSLDYIGDAARLYADGQMVDDQFADGEPWIIGIHRFVRADGAWPSLELRIVPANPDLPIFIEAGARQRLQAAAPMRAGLLSASARVWRRARLHFGDQGASRGATWLD